MEFRSVGNSDLRVSVVGLGCNNFGGRLDREGSALVIDRAVERGITLFDTADSYGNLGGSETALGELLGTRRKDVVIATKFGWPMDDSGRKQGGSRRYVFEAVEASLGRLRTDWIDLYQFHRPDPEVPIEETLSALAELVQQGKIRHFGCSSFEATQLAEADVAASKLGTPGFIACQHHYNLLTRDIETGILPEMQRLGMSLLPYAPLASGLLSGKYRHNAPMPAEGRIAKSPKQAERYLSEANWLVIEALLAFAEGRGRTLLDLAVAWVAANPLVCSVMAGAMTAEQVDANVDAAQWVLSAEDLAEIDTITAHGKA